MLIDVNTSYGPWPFAPLGCETIKDLDQRLEKHKIAKALTSPLRSVFYEDPHPANLELLRKSKRFPRIIPVPTLNPELADALENLESYRSDFPLAAVKLYPNFHDYPLNAKRCSELLAFLEQEQIPLILNFRLEDERHLFHALRLKEVSLRQTKSLTKRFPKLRILCLGLYREEIKELGSSCGQLRFDLSFADWYRLIPNLLQHVTEDQLMFGSHTPLMVTEANTYKLRSSPIENRIRKKIGHENARRFFDIKD